MKESSPIIAMGLERTGMLISSADNNHRVHRKEAKVESKSDKK